VTLCAAAGFSDIESKDPQDKKSKIYSPLLSDTARVTQSEPVISTGDTPFGAWCDLILFTGEGDEPAPEPKASKAKKDSSALPLHLTWP